MNVLVIYGVIPFEILFGHRITVNDFRSHSDQVRRNAFVFFIIIILYIFYSNLQLLLKTCNKHTLICRKKVKAKVSK